MNKTNLLRATALAAALVSTAGYVQAQEVNAWDTGPLAVESLSTAPESRQEVKAEWLAARNDGWVNSGEAPEAQMALRKPSMKMETATTRAEVVADFKEARSEGMLDEGEVGANDQVLEARDAYNERERAESERAAVAAPVAPQANASPDTAQPTGNMDGSTSAEAATTVDTAPAAATAPAAQPSAEQATQPAPAAAQ